jgi:hypothetical protein
MNTDGIMKTHPLGVFRRSDHRPSRCSSVFIGGQFPFGSGLVRLGDDRARGARAQDDGGDTTQKAPPHLFGFDPSAGADEARHALMRVDDGAADAQPIGVCVAALNPGAALHLDQVA